MGLLCLVEGSRDERLEIVIGVVSASGRRYSPPIFFPSGFPRLMWSIEQVFVTMLRPSEWAPTGFLVFFCLNFSFGFWSVFVFNEGDTKSDCSFSCKNLARGFGLTGSIARG